MKIKRYYWTEEFDEESFDKFIKFQNELTEEDSFEVWLDSDGGSCMIAEMLKELFESYPTNKFQLIASGRVCSSALDLFVATDCRKHIIPGTLGMIHTISRNVKVDYKGKPKTRFSEDKIINNTYPIVDKIESIISKVLTPEEMRMYFDNQDVWLSTDEIKKLLT